MENHQYHVTFDYFLILNLGFIIKEYFTLTFCTTSCFCGFYFEVRSLFISALVVSVYTNGLYTWWDCFMEQGNPPSDVTARSSDGLLEEEQE